MTANERAFDALVLKGMELNQPRHYTDDLHYHDKAALGLTRVPEAPYVWTVKEGSPFLWIVRDCGTELIGFDDEGELWNMSTLGYYAKGGFGHDNVTYWWWDGDSLSRTDAARAARRLDMTRYHLHRARGHSRALDA